MNENKTNKPQLADEPGKEQSSVPVSTAEKTKTTKGRPRRKRGIMRSFFSHIIVAALAVAGVGGYFHWEDILSQTGGRVCAYEVLGKYGSSQPGTKPMALPAATQPEGSGTSAPVKTGEQTSEMKVDEKPAAEEVAMTKEAATTEVVTTEVASASVPAAEELKTAEVTEKSDAEKSQDTKVVVVEETQKKTFESEWLDARRAYWAGDESAEKSYLELIAKYPQQADIKGELGNIYVKAGEKEKAAGQFLDAGMIWAKSGEKDKAAKIIGLLQDLDPAKATSLKEALTDAE